MYIQSKGGNSKINFPHLHNTDIHMLTNLVEQRKIPTGLFIWAGQLKCGTKSFEATNSRHQAALNS